MIHIIDIAQKIDSFLENKGFEKYKIFVRINFSLDVYVFTAKQVTSQGLREMFVKGLTDLMDVKGSSESMKISTPSESTEDGMIDYYLSNILEFVHNIHQNNNFHYNRYYYSILYFLY